MKKNKFIGIVVFIILGVLPEAACGTDVEPLSEIAATPDVGLEKYIVEKHEDEGTEVDGQEKNALKPKAVEQEVDEQEWFEQWMEQLDSDERRRDEYTVIYHAEVVQYMIEQPSSFILHVNKNKALSLLPEEHRNVNRDYMVDENGKIKNLTIAYVADMILDKYIREYGGEDIEYDIKSRSFEEWEKHPEQFDEIFYYDIKGNDVTIKVIFNYEPGIVIALIEGDDNVETRTTEYIKFLQYEDRYGWDYTYSAERKKYWMIINKDNLKDNYHYRNVVASDELSDSEDLKCGVQEYYIADQVINRYILDKHGSDEIYEVTLLDKKQDADGNMKYSLSVSDGSGNEVLQIEYEDTSWWVTVTINV